MYERFRDKSAQCFVKGNNTKRKQTLENTCQDKTDKSK